MTVRQMMDPKSGSTTLHLTALFWMCVRWPFATLYYS